MVKGDVYAICLNLLFPFLGGGLLFWRGADVLLLDYGLINLSFLDP
jgi:hypothetical protein